MKIQHYNLRKKILLFFLLIFLLTDCKNDKLLGTPVKTTPVLITKVATSISNNSATSGGEVQSDGGLPVTARGVIWSSNPNPTIVLPTKTTDGTGSGSFISNLTGLMANTVYYYKAYATNDKGTAYGDELIFSTSATSATLTTIPATIITASTAISGGIINNDGGSPIIQRGTCWGLTANPEISNSKTIDGTGIGSFTSNLTGLAASTKYFYRAYATNNTGTAYGNELNFTTPENPVYKLFGLDFSPYMDGQSPDAGTQISESQISSLIQKVAPYTKWLRSYGSTDGLQKVGVHGHNFGLKVAAGAWLSNNIATNQTQIANLIAMGQAGEIDVAIVGSEALLRGDITKSQLISYIHQVKAALPPNIPVTTAEVYQTFLSNPDLVSEVDVLYVHIYPFWEGISINCATNFIDNVYSSVQAVSQGKEIVVAETGWPSDGDTFGKSVPSLVNANTFFLHFVSWAKIKQVKYFYFEAFDETWKLAHEGTRGIHWGLWEKNNGLLKAGMHGVFDGQTIPNNWELDTAVILSNPPSISFTLVPPIGSLLNLEGIAKGVLPSLYRVAVYIYVNGCWWTKPTFTEPLTRLNCDGSFVCDITTGGNDPDATFIRAYLLPATYNPPSVSCFVTIPAEIQQNAVAWLEVPR